MYIFFSRTPKDSLSLLVYFKMSDPKLLEESCIEYEIDYPSSSKSWLWEGCYSALLISNVTHYRQI